MAPKKNKSRKSGRVRRSTAGKILPPLDVRSNKQLKEFERRIKQGGITIVLVWAPWCGHCHKFMPHFDAAAKSPGRSIQAVKVEETMLPAVNAVLTNNINRAAKPLSVEGYPSLIIVDKHGKAVTSIEAVKNTEVMTNVMNNAGAFAEETGINLEENIVNLTKPIPPSLSNTQNEFPSTQPVINLGSNTMSIGKPSVLRSVKEPSVLRSVKEPSVKTPSVIKPVTIPSSTIMPSNITNTSARPPSIPKKLLEEDGDIVSLSSPLILSPSNPASDRDESILKSLTTEQKLRGGGGHGGSLYSSILRTTYTLAPAAALLATASIVLKKSKRTKRTKRTKRLNKKSPKTRKMRKN
jgi:thiol-disulfide isomerase/thioredoxin